VAPIGVKDLGQEPNRALQPGGKTVDAKTGVLASRRNAATRSDKDLAKVFRMRMGEAPG